MAGLVSYGSPIVPLSPGVRVFVQPPTPSLPLASIPISLPSASGVGSWGTPDVPLYAGPSLDSLAQAVGTMTSDRHSLYMWGANVLERAPSVVLIRRTNGQDTPAQIVLTNADGTIFGTITMACSGDLPNPIAAPAIDATGGAYLAWAPGSGSTVTKPVFDFTFYIPRFPSQVFPGIIGWKATTVNNVTTYAYDEPTLIANLNSAINLGTAQSAPSGLCVFTSGTSTHPALTIPATSYVTVLGTNGADGVTDSYCLGTDGIGATRTGMYALRGTSFTSFNIAGQTDPTVGVSIAQFVVSEIGVGFAMTGPAGTDTKSAIAIKQTNNMLAPALITPIDYVTVIDPKTQVQRLVDPMGSMAGLLGSILPEEDILNKPEEGMLRILSSERSSGIPLDGPELDLRSQNGLPFFYNAVPGLRGGGLWVAGNGKNASSIPGRDTINYVTLTNYLIKALFAILGPYVGLLQSGRADDPLRAAVSDIVRDFFQTLKEQGRIDDFYVVSDLTNNLPGTIAAGRLLLNVYCVYLATAQNILPTLQGGTTVVIPVTPTALAA